VCVPNSAHHTLTTGRLVIMQAHSCCCRSLRLSLCQMLRVVQMSSAGCSQLEEVFLSSCHSLRLAGVFADRALQCTIGA
jgi:hypothetical protein